MVGNSNAGVTERPVKLEKLNKFHGNIGRYSESVGIRGMIFNWKETCWKQVENLHLHNSEVS